LRRARFAVRLIYGLITLGLIGLGVAAFIVFAPEQVAHNFSHTFSHFFGH
jgi:uncharacterized membrane protein